MSVVVLANPVKKGQRPMRQSSDPDANPFHALPPVVVALALAMFAVELLLSAGARGFIGGPTAVGWRLEALQTFGFSPAVLAWMVETGTWPLEHVVRFVSYVFVHYSFMHMVMAEVFLLALGKLVAETLGARALLIVFFASAAFGALIYGGIAPVQSPALVGGYPAAYGLIGVYTFLLWTRAVQKGEGQYRAFTLIGFLLALQLIFGALFGGTLDWVADLSGFAIGFLLAPVVAPGGVTRLMDKLRQR